MDRVAYEGVVNIYLSMQRIEGVYTFITIMMNENQNR